MERCSDRTTICSGDEENVYYEKTVSEVHGGFQNAPGETEVSLKGFGVLVKSSQIE